MKNNVSLSCFTGGILTDFEQVMSKREQNDIDVQALLQDATSGYTWFVHSYSPVNKVVKVSTSHINGEISLLKKYIIAASGKFAFLQISELPKDLYYIDILDEAITYGVALEDQMTLLTSIICK